MSFRSTLLAATARPYKRHLLYLESTGTQYIDTGIVPTNSTRVEITLAEAFNANGTSPFGVFDNVTGKSYGLLITGAGQWTLCYGTHWLDAFGYAADVTKMTIENGKVYFNGIQKKTSDGDFSCGGSLFLYAARRVNSGGVPQFLSSCKISSCKIWKNGSTLSRDLIPVLDFDDIPCMYDKVTGQFLYNQGSGVFRRGPAFLNYLESTGTQYIDTGIAPTGSTKVEIVLAEAFNANGTSPFGVFDNEAGKSYGLLITGAGQWTLCYGTHWLDAFGYAADATKITIENGKVYFNDIQKKTSDGEFTCTGSMFLYAARRVNSGGVPQFLSSCKISSCKISSCKIWQDGSILSRDLIPALDPDNIACMYDKVTGTYPMHYGAFLYK